MYDNKVKEAWRGWAWNQIKNRLKSSFNKRVCVLAGDIAGDLPKSVKHGFECVGVDVNQACVDEFRSSGGVAVKDQLRYQLACLKPDGLIADLTSGTTTKNLAMLCDSIYLCDAVVFNFLRGRDKGMHEVDGTAPSYSDSGQIRLRVERVT